MTTIEETYKKVYDIFENNQDVVPEDDDAMMNLISLINEEIDNLLHPDSMKYYDDLNEIKEYYEGDTELFHQEMDALMCRILVDYGFDDIVIAFHNHPKWWA